MVELRTPLHDLHGELAGLMAIRAALTARGDARKVVLVPDSAHGTNPATAHMCNYAIESIPHNARGRVDLKALKARLGPDVAAFMGSPRLSTATSPVPINSSSTPSAASAPGSSQAR